MSETTENTTVTTEEEYFESNLTGQQVEDALTAIIDGTIDNSVEASATKATEAQSWAVGGTGTRPNEEITNAKYYAEMAAGGSTTDGNLNVVGSLAVGQKDNIDRGDIDPSLENAPWLTVGNGCVALGKGSVATGEGSMAIQGYVYAVKTQKISGVHSLYFTFDSLFPASTPLNNFRPEAGTKVLIFKTNFSAPPLIGTLSSYNGSYTMYVNLNGVDTADIKTIYDYVLLIYGTTATSLKANNHAEGNRCVATGKYTHAEGTESAATNESAHAEGKKTKASGVESHAEGFATNASGEASHAEGFQTRAVGTASHAEGYNTSVWGKYSHVEGKYNVADMAGNYQHIVGNGTSEGARSNAYTLDWSGNGWFAGNVTIGTAANVADPTADNELIPKAYFDKVVGALEARIAALEGNE